MIPILTILLFIYVKNRRKKDFELADLKSPQIIYDYIFLSLVALASYKIQDCLLVLLAGISIVDYREKIIENSLNLLILIFSVPNLIIVNLKTLITPLLLSSMFLLVLMVIFSLSGGGLGFGDIKLLLALTISKGGGFLFSTIFFTAILIFVRASISLIKEKDTKLQIPLAPYIFFSTLLISI